MANLVDEISSNKRRSVLLISSFVALTTVVVLAFNWYLRGGYVGAGIALVFVLITTWISYYNSDKIALTMSRAKPADPDEYAQLHNIVEGLALAGGMPKPRVYVVDDMAPNAFATGRNPENSAIAVTTGLLAIMNRQELEGVLAHELAHIRDYDILVSTLAVTMVGLITLLADIGLRAVFYGFGNRDRAGNSGPFMLVLGIVALILLILSPFLAKLMQAAVSRNRESLADVEGVNLTRYPQGLMSALQKLQANSSVVSTSSRATAHLWIESPLDQSGDSKISWLNKMYNTHPPLEERIAVLNEMVNDPRFSA